MKTKDGEEIKVGEIYYLVEDGKIETKVFSEKDLKTLEFYGRMYKWSFDTPFETNLIKDRNYAIDTLIERLREDETALETELNDVRDKIEIWKEELK